MLKTVLTIAFLVSQTLCWWEAGHYLVAQIAQDELKAQNETMYNIANTLVESLNTLADGNTQFITASIWPDQIRLNKTMSFWNQWHWWNRPYNPDRLYIRQSESGSRIHAYDCLQTVEKILKDKPEEPNLLKAVMMRYALHVVGDIHQPLHSTSLYNATFPEGSGDKGGSSLNIKTPEGNEMNLHSYWDTGALFFNPLPHPEKREFKFPLNEEELQSYSDRAAEIKTAYPKEHFGGLVDNLDFFDWTSESLDFAHNTTYPLVGTTDQLTQEYQDKAQEVAKQRVALAGYRLANFFIKTFTKEVEEP